LACPADARAVAPPLERAGQFRLLFQGHLLIRAQLKINAADFVCQPQPARPQAMHKDFQGYYLNLDEHLAN
jgi:hypothetical protein